MFKDIVLNVMLKFWKVGKKYISINLKKKKSSTKKREACISGM